MRSSGVLKTYCKAIVNSTVPRLDERCPPVFDTESSTKARSSSANGFNWVRGSCRRSAGLFIVLSMLGCSPLICYCEEAVAASRTVLLMPRHSSYTSLCILLSLCCLLCLALHDQIGQLMQAARLVAKLLQRLMRIAAQFFCQCLRFAQTKDRHVGRLVVSGILAGSLAERGGVRRRIKNIVDHLKRQTDSAGVGFQRCGFRRRQQLAAVGPEQNRCTQQRSRFEPVHLFQFRQRQSHTDAGQIDGLTTAHACRAGSLGQQMHHLQLTCGLLFVN